MLETVLIWTHLHLLHRLIRCRFSPAAIATFRITVHSARCDAAVFYEFASQKRTPGRHDEMAIGLRLSVSAFCLLGHSRRTRPAQLRYANIVQPLSVLCRVPARPLSSSQLSQRICLCAQAAKSIVPPAASCLLPAARAGIRQLLLCRSEKLTTAFTSPLAAHHSPSAFL